MLDSFLIVLEIFLLTLAAGLCIPIGGVLARIEQLAPKWLETELRLFIMALGGGVLLAGVSLVLVPEGIAGVKTPELILFWMLMGGSVFCVLDRLQAMSQTFTPQLSAMLLDFIPETLALGGLFAASSEKAIFLAILIGLQNIPEGFNAYRELDSQRSHHTTQTLTTMVLLALIAPVVGIAGWLFFSDDDVLFGSIMLFSAGGILYLVFQDIAPNAKLEKHWGPALGAVVGFVLALYFQLILA